MSVRRQKPSYGLPEASPLSVLEGGSDAHSATASTSGMPWRAISRWAAASSRLPGRANGSGTGIGGMARSPSAIVRHTISASEHALTDSLSGGSASAAASVHGSLCQSPSSSSGVVSPLAGRCPVGAEGLLRTRDVL